MIPNFVWSGIFWLEILIFYSVFEVDRKNHNPVNPRTKITMSREKLNRARANSSAETSLARAIQRERLSTAPPTLRPSWVNLSKAFAKTHADCPSTRRLTAAATTRLSQINEDDTDFELGLQIGESACFPKLSEGDHSCTPKRRNRAGTCPGLGVDRMGKGDPVLNEHGEFAGNLPLPSLGSVAYDPAAPEVTNLLESRISVGLEDETWQETQECYESETYHLTGMMLSTTGGTVGASASPEFRAYLQRIFEAEQEVEMRTAAMLNAVEEPDFDTLPPTTHIREKAKEFLRELQESPPADLQDLFDAFTSLDEANAHAPEGKVEDRPKAIAREGVSVIERVSRLEMPVSC